MEAQTDATNLATRGGGGVIYLYAPTSCQWTPLPNVAAAESHSHVRIAGELGGAAVGRQDDGGFGFQFQVRDQEGRVWILELDAEAMEEMCRRIEDVPCEMTTGEANAYLRALCQAISEMLGAETARVDRLNDQIARQGGPVQGMRTDGP